jgi:4'-phosphopantetheinyl transferase EntD
VPHAVAVLAVRDAVHEHGVDVEPEAEREHDGTVAPLLAAAQDDASCYPAGEEGVAEAVGASR